MIVMDLYYIHINNFRHDTFENTTFYLGILKGLIYMLSYVN